MVGGERDYYVMISKDLSVPSQSFLDEEYISC